MSTLGDMSRVTKYHIPCAISRSRFSTGDFWPTLRRPVAFKKRWKWVKHRQANYKLVEHKIWSGSFQSSAKGNRYSLNGTVTKQCIFVVLIVSIYNYVNTDSKDNYEVMCHKRQYSKNAEAGKVWSYL